MEIKGSLDQLKTKIWKHRISVAFVMLLLFTQIHILFPNTITLSGMTRIYITNIVIFVYSAYFVLYRLFFKKEFTKLSKRSRFVFWSVVVFCVYILASYGYRAIALDNTSISLAMTQTILLSSIAFLVIDLKKISFDDIIAGISVFTIMINLVVMYIVLILNTSLRKIPVLGNVNIYIGFILLITPILMYYYTTKFHQKGYRILFYFTLLSMMIGLIFTGSRFSFVFYIVELAGTYLLIEGFKFNWRRAKNLVFIVIGTTFITIVFSSNNVVVKEDILRTFSIPNQVISMVLNTGSGQSIMDSINKDIIPDSELPPDDPSAPVASMTRSWLFAQSLHEIEDHLILGKGTHAVFLRGWGYQSPHNFILEIILCYGILGGLIYSALAFYPVYLMIRNRKSKKSLLFLLGYGSVFLFSMVEPLLADKLIILLPFWSLTGGLYAIEEEKA